MKLLGNILFVNKPKYGTVKDSVFHHSIPDSHNTSSTSLTVSPSTSIQSPPSNVQQAVSETTNHPDTNCNSSFLETGNQIDVPTPTN